MLLTNQEVSAGPYWFVLVIADLTGRIFGSGNSCECVHSLWAKKKRKPDSGNAELKVEGSSPVSRNQETHEWKAGGRGGGARVRKTC